MTHLALVLGGTASLGAYTGGAVDEVFRALQRNRREEDVRLGVVTGASSGAIAAAMAARAAVVNPALVPWAAKFWRLGLRDELLLDPDRDDRTGWLATGALEQLLGELVDGPSASDDGPAPFLSEALHLGFSLQRLGPALGGAVGGPGEEIVFRLGASHAAGHPVWAEVLEAALAGSALPLVFPPRRAPAGEDDDRPTFRVGDGLATERPLSLAHRLAAGHPAADGAWRFVVVAPGLGGDGEADDREPPSEVADVAALLARSAVGRGMALDLLGASGDEERAELLRALVHRLPDIHGRLDDPEAVGLGRRVGELAERVAEWEVERGAFRPASSDPVLDHLDRELARIQERTAYAAAFSELDGRAGRTRMAKLVYVLEATAGLRGHQDRRIHLVAPDADRPLAGGGMAGLRGFFSREAREADFAAGRRDARRVLEGGLSDLVGYEPDEEPAYRAESPAGEGLTGLSSEERRRLRSFLRREADRRLDDLAPGGIAGLFFGWARSGVRERMVERLLDRLDAA